MTISLVILTVSGILLITLFLLNQAEMAKGRRIVLVKLRDRLDLVALRRMESWQRWKKYFGASSFRLFLHYVLHQTLGAVLFVIRWSENSIHNLRRKNKLIAKVTSHDNDNHLSHIARHKEETALSEEERRERRERSLND